MSDKKTKDSLWPNGFESTDLAEGMKNPVLSDLIVNAVNQLWFD